MVDLGNRHRDFVVMNLIYNAVRADPDAVAILLAPHFHAAKWARIFRQFGDRDMYTGLNLKWKFNSCRFARGRKTTVYMIIYDLFGDLFPGILPPWECTRPVPP